MSLVIYINHLKMHCLLLVKIVEIKLDDYNEMSSSSSSSSIGCLSADSSSNSVSSNMVEDGDDAYSSSPANRVEQMFQLSDLMSQLPIKRGLSRYYNGKSDSFKNLTSIKSLEDVPKLSSKGRSSNNRCQKFYTTPKSKISKNNNKASTWISGRSNRLTTSSNTRICTRFIHA